jgi:hypothetical protein
MKNIMLSADGGLIAAARERARAEHTTLNEQFCRWLAGCTGRRQRTDRAIATIPELQGRLNTGGHKFTRDEINQR